MENYDDYITGLMDENSPMNQKEIEVEIEEELSLKEAYDTGHEHIFDQELQDLRLELNNLKDFADSLSKISTSAGYGIISKRLTKIINKI